MVIHKKGCANAEDLKGRTSLKVGWKKCYNQETEVKIFATDRVGLFADVLNTIAATGTNITRAKGKTINEDSVEISFGMIPEDLDHLENILKRIQKIQSVNRVAIEIQKEKEF